MDGRPPRRVGVNPAIGRRDQDGSGRVAGDDDVGSRSDQAGQARDVDAVGVGRTDLGGQFASGVGGDVGDVAAAFDGGLPTIPGLFLLGFALAHYDVPRRLDGNIRANGILLIVATMASTSGLYWQHVDPMAPGFSPSSAVAGLAMATMYMALLNFLMSTPLRAGVLALFAPLGRMSLTNYIGASLLFLATVPLRPMIGADGDSPTAWATAMGVVAVILVVQWVFSTLWLRHFRQGPLEWVWRRATWAGAKPAP